MSYGRSDDMAEEDLHLRFPGIDQGGKILGSIRKRSRINNPPAQKRQVRFFPDILLFWDFSRNLGIDERPATIRGKPGFRASGIERRFTPYAPEKAAVKTLSY